MPHDGQGARDIMSRRVKAGPRLTRPIESFDFSGTGATPAPRAAAPRRAMAIPRPGEATAEPPGRLARGMDLAAEWIRDVDLDGFRNDIERQVRDHPMRTLLVAAGVGYLIGRSVRK